MQNTQQPVSEQPFRLIHFGVDYVRLVFSRFFHSDNLSDFFNSLEVEFPHRDVEWYGFRFSLDYSYGSAKQSLMFSYHQQPVFFLCKYSADTGPLGKYLSYSIDLYSTAYCLPELQPFFIKFWKYIGMQGKITRLDLACDLVCTPKQLLSAGHVTQFPKGAMLGYREKTGDVETRYFGEKHSRNKRHLIRVYDKLKDSQKDPIKRKLFAEYFHYPNVTRVEVEIRSLTAKQLHLTPEKLGDFDFLESIFRTLVINESGTCLNALKQLDLAKVDKIHLDREQVKLPMGSLQLANRFFGMAKNLHDSGADPVGYLIKNFANMGVYRNPIYWRRLNASVNNLLWLELTPDSESFPPKDDE